MARLGHVLKDHDGLESVNADFQGNVTLVYDDERTDRDALVAAMQRGGFSEIAASVRSGNHPARRTVV